MSGRLLVSTETSGKIDALARTDWGFNDFAQVEAAGRSCAHAFAAAHPGFFKGKIPKIVVAAGTGNNGADALVMLRYWLLSGLASSSSAVLMTTLPADSAKTPCSELLKSLRKMKVPVLVWGAEAGEELAQADIIIDGIMGTGARGEVSGNAAEMIRAINHLNQLREGRIESGRHETENVPFIVSVDLSSGNSDTWKPFMPIVKADITMAIEPRKYCLYNPSSRPFAGTIIPVGGIFPADLLDFFSGAELLDWDGAQKFLPPVKSDAYKHERGSVEIRAGAVGTTGAAALAARGAQAAGAGLVRLVADDDIYPILASGAGGIMVVPASKADAPQVEKTSFKSDALLLGPGWGKTEDRRLVLEKALDQEKNGVPLILDADAITLAREAVFHGNVILTPHPGEFAALTGKSVGEIFDNPVPLLLKTAAEKKALIILKGHVITIADWSGRWGVIDGMAPLLSAGGSGDLLAGFCAALAARMARQKRFDAYNSAAAASALLIAAGKSWGKNLRFTDPLEIADRAAELAGRAWLKGNHE